MGRPVRYAAHQSELLPGFVARILSRPDSQPDPTVISVLGDHLQDIGSPIGEHLSRWADDIANRFRGHIPMMSGDDDTVHGADGSKVIMRRAVGTWIGSDKEVPLVRIAILGPKYDTNRQDRFEHVRIVAVPVSHPSQLSRPGRPRRYALAPRDVWEPMHRGMAHGHPSNFRIFADYLEDRDDPRHMILRAAAREGEQTASGGPFAHSMNETYAGEGRRVRLSDGSTVRVSYWEGHYPGGDRVRPRLEWDTGLGDGSISGAGYGGHVTPDEARSFINVLARDHPEVNDEGGMGHEHGRWERSGRLLDFGPGPHQLSRPGLPARYKLDAGRAFVSALRRLRSKQQQALHGVARQIASSLQLAPAKTRDAIHDTPQQSTPSIAQAVASGDPATVRYAASWYGLLSRTPQLVAFHVRPEGPDSVYKFEARGSGEELRGKLDRAGVTNRVLLPTRQGFEVLVFDPARQMRDRVKTFVRAHGTVAEESRGVGEVLGSDDPAKAREKFRGEVARFEVGPKRMARSGRPRRMARIDPAKMETLRKIEPRATKGFRKWMDDLYHDDKAMMADNLADEESRLDHLDDYLNEEHQIRVRPDGLVEFWQADSPTRHLVGDLPVVLFHHTSSALDRKITKEGMKVVRHRVSNPHQNTQSGVYLTTERSGPVVQGYHDRAVGALGGHERTWGVVTTLDEIEPDPDDQDIRSGRHQFIVPSVPPDRLIHPAKLRRPGRPARFALGHTVGPGRRMRSFSGEEMFHHEIMDPSGRSVGAVRVIPRGPDLHVEWAGLHGSAAGESAHELGMSAVLPLRHQLASHYPQATHFTGRRVGGARMGMGGMEQRVRIPIRRYMRRGRPRRMSNVGPAEFHRAIAAEPDDPLHSLVYADWHEEQGRPVRAAFIRRAMELKQKPHNFNAGPHEGVRGVTLGYNYPKGPGEADVFISEPLTTYVYEPHAEEGDRNVNIAESNLHDPSTEFRWEARLPGAEAEEWVRRLVAEGAAPFNKTAENLASPREEYARRVRSNVLTTPARYALSPREHWEPVAAGLAQQYQTWARREGSDAGRRARHEFAARHGILADRLADADDPREEIVRRNQVHWTGGNFIRPVGDVARDMGVAHRFHGVSSRLVRLPDGTDFRARGYAGESGAPTLALEWSASTPSGNVSFEGPFNVKEAIALAARLHPDAHRAVVEAARHATRVARGSADARPFEYRRPRRPAVPKPSNPYVLLYGRKSKKWVSAKIRKLRGEGKKQDVAVAEALHMAGVPRKKS